MKSGEGEWQREKETKQEGQIEREREGSLVRHSYAEC